MTLRKQSINKAIRHLRAADPVMKDVVRQVGPFTLKLQRDRFAILVRSIISQQISMSAAKSIRKKLEALLAPEKPSPDNIARLEPEVLRTAGLSAQKSKYLHDLSACVLDGRVPLNRIGRKPDEEVIAELVQVKGIGRWTAQMFLIFSLGRLDVFPHDDLGIRTAIRDLYRLDDLPDKTTGHRIAEPWRPYASVASWYCWRSIELARNGATFGGK